MSDLPANVLLTVEPDDRPDFPGYFAVVPHSTEREQHGRPILRSFDSRAAAWHLAVWRRFEQSDTLPQISPGGMFPADGGWTYDPRFAYIEEGQTTAEQYQQIQEATNGFIRRKIGDSMSDDQQTTETPEQEWEYPEPEGLVTVEHDDREPEAEPEPEAKPKRKRKTKAEREAEKAAKEEAESVDSADHAREHLTGREQQAADAHESDSESLTDDEGASAQPEDSEPADRPERRSAVMGIIKGENQNAYDNFSALAQSAPSDAGREFWQAKANALIE